MSPGRIPPSTSLVDALRAIALSRSGSTAESQPAPRPSGTDTSSAPATASGAGELKRRMRELVKGVNVRDPQSLANARTPIIREILLSEFGPDFRQDAQFGPMIEAIGKSFDADPQFDAQFGELVASLKKMR